MLEINSSKQTYMDIVLFPKDDRTSYNPASHRNEQRKAILSHTNG